MRNYYLQDMLVPLKLPAAWFVILRQPVSPDTYGPFGLAHINFANVIFDHIAEQNMQMFVKAYQSVGGDLKKTSIHIYGGLRQDENKVRDKVITLLTHFTSIEKKDMFIPSSGIVETNEEEARKNGNGQVLSICCNNKEIYSRKVYFEKGKKRKVELLPLSSSYDNHPLNVRRDTDSDLNTLIDQSCLLVWKNKTIKS